MYSTTILHKRKTPSTCKYLKDQPVKKLKVASSVITENLKSISHNHLGFIWKSLSFIKERNILVTTGTEGSIALWDAKNRFRHIRTIDAFKHLIIYSVVYIERLNAVACSSTDNSPIKIFEIDDGRLLFELSKEREYFNFLDLVYFEKDNCLIAGGFDQNLLFFDLQSQKQIHSIPLGSSIGAIKCIKGTHLVIAGLWGGCVKAVNLASKKVIFSKQAHQEGYIMCLQVIESRYLMISCGDDSRILLWSLKRGVPDLMKTVCLFKPRNSCPSLRNMVKLKDRYLVLEYESSLIVVDILNGKRLNTKCTKEEIASMLKINDVLMFATEGQKLEYLENLQNELLRFN